MTYADFYLICFIVGLALSCLSFLLGSFHWQLPHLTDGAGIGHAGGDFHVHFGGDAAVGADAAAAGHMGGGHIGDAGHAAAGHAGDVATHGALHVSPLNFMTLTAFLAWFGGTGYLLARFSSLWMLAGLVAAAGSGLVGAGIVFVFMSRVMMAAEEAMDPDDYEMVGVLGHISSSIREGGTGELVYAQAGTRHVCGARSEDGTAIPKGTEVVVTRYEHGLAYVERWAQLAGETEESVPPA
jgi:membrane protein implicated in regulation of membrane protease activity